MKYPAVLFSTLLLAMSPLAAHADAAEELELEQERRKETAVLLAEARNEVCLVSMTYFRRLKPGRLLLRVFVERKLSEPIVIRGDLETANEINQVRVLNVILGDVEPETLIEVPTVSAAHPEMSFYGPYISEGKSYLVALTRNRGRYTLDQAYSCQEG